MIDRADVESLLGAYALDALSLEEHRRVEAALASDPSLAQAAGLDLAVAAALAEGAVDPADRAPVALWTRIAAATGPLAPGRPAPHPSWWRRWLSAAVATTSLAAGVVLAVVAVHQHTRITDFEQNPLAVAAAEARRQEGSQIIPLSGEVQAEVVLAADGTGYVLTPEAPALPGDGTYQLWAIVGERVISAGVLGPAPEVAAFHVSGEVAGFALTVEVAGGVVASEQQPVAIGLIQG